MITNGVEVGAGVGSGVAVAGTGVGAAVGTAVASGTGADGTFPPQAARDSIIPSASSTLSTRLIVLSFPAKLAGLRFFFYKCSGFPAKINIQSAGFSPRDRFSLLLS